MAGLADVDAARPDSLSNAMARYAGMFDVVRDGPPSHGPAEIPDDPDERARHLKAAATYFDVSMVGLCALPAAALLVPLLAVFAPIGPWVGIAQRLAFALWFGWWLAICASASGPGSSRTAGT